MQALTYVELDIVYCSLVYGVPPCQAGIPQTGSAKCLNSKATCQDTPNFTPQDITLRFSMPADYLPDDIEITAPSIKAIDYTPVTISLGADLGQRASLKVVFFDHRHSDTGSGFDKYHSERSYNPFLQGTFWGKFRARQPFLRGRSIRLIRGQVGQTLAQMETRHFIVESFDGPTPDGEYTLVAKDVLKLADGDRAQAPALSNGFLVAAITAVATTATLSPSGIGLEYPASGHVAIGGKEIVAFTRSGDVLTLTRAQLGTAAQAHEAEDRVQLVLRYVGQDPAVIIRDLLVTYAGVSADYISLATWQSETATYLNRVFTATIAEPTSVNKLISELIEQAALSLWWDDVNERLQLRVLRAIATTADTFDEDSVLEGSLELREQPDKRLSQVWTYYAKINPLVKEDESDNYRSTEISIDSDAEEDYGSAAIKKIFSRWIPQFGRSTASRINDIQLARFRDPPRRFTFDLMRGAVDDPSLGQGYRIEAWPLQEPTGAPASVPIQITRLRPEAHGFELEAEEMLFAGFDDIGAEDSPATSVRTITIDANTNDFNLRTTHDSLFTAPVGGEDIHCIVTEGVIVGSTSNATPAFDVGSWPANVIILLSVTGRVQGKGGDGGQNDPPGADGGPGQPGGLALYTRYAIDLDLSSAEIWGGGGGGGGTDAGSTGGTGGGGAGTLPGQPGFQSGGAPSGAAGTATAGGAGGDGSGSDGGAGGGPGLAGSASTGLDPGLGGAAGAAIDGVSFVVMTTGGPGDVRGSQIN